MRRQVGSGGNGEEASMERVIRRGLTVGFMAALLGACSLPGGGSTAVETFDLRAPAVSSTAPKGRPIQVLVPEPVADRAFDTDRIVVRPRAAEISYFAGAQWSDRLPRLVQSRLIEALEASGRVRAGRPGQGLAIDRQVVGEIRSFDYDARAARVVVALSVKLMDDRTGRVIASEQFQAEEPVASDDARGAVTAFDAAQGRVIGDIVGWVAKRG